VDGICLASFRIHLFGSAILCSGIGRLNKERKGESDSRRSFWHETENEQDPNLPWLSGLGAKCREKLHRINVVSLLIRRGILKMAEEIITRDCPIRMINLGNENEFATESSFASVAFSSFG
jgi:hypothetical protein